MHLSVRREADEFILGPDKKPSDHHTTFRNSICGNDGRYTEDLAGRRIKYWRIVAYEVFKTD